MSTTSTARSTAYNDRRTRTTRPRVPSLRDDAKQRPISQDEHLPKTPVGAAAVPLPPSGGTSWSGRTKESVTFPTERKTENTQVTTKEKIQVRMRSPRKQTTHYKDERPRSSDGEGIRPHSRAGAGAESLPASKKDHEITRAQSSVKVPWKPQVSLIQHTTAPLASRISIPPLASNAPQSIQPEPLAQLSPEVQEASIIEDLLFVFMGYEGQYIRFLKTYNPSIEKERLVGPGFRILPGLDLSLRDLTNTMLKMATHYSALEAFIEVQSREEFGAVNHALCAAVRKLLKDYLILIAQLEHQMHTNPSFTLHVLHLRTMPTAHMLLQLYLLAQELLKRNSLLGEDLEDFVDQFENDDDILENLREGGNLDPGSMSVKRICKGGSVLRLLTERLASMAGDPAARTLLTALLRDASRPYMTMLNEWLHRGGIKDPHGEFLVREQKSIMKERLDEDYTDQYWEKRYTFRDHDVPPQLEGVKDKVLLAGKYLNVVRECGGVDVSKEVKDVPTTFDDVRFLDNVNGAYAHANFSLLELLLTTHALPARLRSLKHYFFLDRSDFFSYFLDLSTPELRKPAKNVNVGKLQSLLDLVLRQPGSIAALDPFKEDVKVQMNEISLTKWLIKVVTTSGIDQDDPEGIEKYTPAAQVPTSEDDKNITGFNALELDYAVPFPLSLVISRKTVLRYQLLFRYLLSLRHLENLLTNSWEEHTKVKSWTNISSDRKVERWKRRTWTLRSRMLVFIQQLLYFCTAEVIEPNWRNLMDRVHGTDEGNHGGPKQVNRTVDELMQDHVDFLDTCLRECMLTNSKLLKILSKSMTACTLFATYTSYLTRMLFTADPDLADTAAAEAYLLAQATPKHPISPSAAAFDPTRLDRMEDILQKYEENFTRHLRILVDALNYFAATETVALLGLCARLSMATDGMATGEVGNLVGNAGL